MATFADVKHKLDEIAEQIRNRQSGINQARSKIDTTVESLTSMVSVYADVISEIEAQATANPTNQAWQLAKSEKDILVSEFQALKTTAEALKAAMDAV